METKTRNDAETHFQNNGLKTMDAAETGAGCQKREEEQGKDTHCKAKAD